jgi:hypothetical protein
MGEIAGSGFKSCAPVCSNGSDDGAALYVAVLMARLAALYSTSSLVIRKHPNLWERARFISALTRVAPFSAVCPGSVFVCLGPWEREQVEKEQVDLPHSRENAYGKERRTSLPSYRSTILRDPK